MRILTWNLWWQFGNWQERQSVIEAVLQSVDADVVCLQEVYVDEHEDQFERLKELLGFHGFATSARPDRRDGVAGSDRARFGNAILSRAPISNGRQLRLPGPDGKPGHRSALIAELSDQPLPTTVACTHLDWRYAASKLRQRQLKAIVEALPVSGPEHLVVLAGDFNAVPESDEMRRLTGLAPGYQDALGETAVFTDSWAAVGEGPGYTWSRENPNSPDAQWPRRRLDSILVGWPRPKPHGNPLRATLAGDTATSAGVVGSDHFAVVVELDPREPFPT